MMKLYWAPRTRSLRALWVIEEIGHTYERIRLDLVAGEQKSREFRAIRLSAGLSVVRPLLFGATVFLGRPVQWRKPDHSAAHAN